MVPLLVALLLALGGGLVIYTTRHSTSNPKRLPLPPSPKPLPIIRNLLQMPKTYLWLGFADWAKTYGDVIHVKILEKHYIILNSFEVVEELMEKRSAIYSDRLRLPMVCKL